jgi:hypothetical protein
VSEAEVHRALLYLEKVVEEHHLLVERLENLVVLDTPNEEEVLDVLKRLRSKRKEIYDNFKAIVDNLEHVTYRPTREEALGIINYYYAVMLPDEKRALEAIPAKVNLGHLRDEVQKDLAMIDKIRNLITRFVY